jgi:ABC-type transport system involved in multi-copper enzyme maturation permease subunit
MVGPVLALELLHASRRGRQHRFRLAYGGWLGIQFIVFAALFLIRFLDNLAWPAGWAGNPSPLSALTHSFLVLLVVQQALLLVLAVPVFAAGAVTEEKTRGTLQNLLTTALTPWEVCTGKLLGQLVRVLDLSLPGWLLLSFVGALDGLQPGQLLALVGGLLAPLPALGAAGLLASVWCRRTANAALAVYGAAALLGALLWGAGALTSPAGPLSFLWRAADAPGAVPPGDLLLSWLAWLCPAVPLLALASWRLRPAYVWQLTAASGRTTGPGSGSGRPPIGDHPVRWKEQYVERVLDLPGLRRLPRGVGVAAVFALAFACSAGILLAHLPFNVGPERVLGLLLRLDLVGLGAALAKSRPSGLAFAVQGAAVVLLAGLAAGSRACGTISGERERQTWEALLLTPLTAKQLIRSKVWGTINVFRPYLVAYTVPALTLAVLAGTTAVVWTVACWALTWVLMYFMAAAGIACSVRSASSWRSWLATLGESGRSLLFYACLVGGPMGLMLSFVLWAVLSAAVLGLGGGPRHLMRATFWVRDFVPLLPCFVTAFFLLARTEQLLMEAERKLDETDRVRQLLRVRPAPAEVRA